MSNVTSVVNHFSTSNEGFQTTLGTTTVPAATTVVLANTSGLTNGTIFVGIIEPGGTKQQVFTGTVNTSVTSITGVVWTRGTDVAHAAGVTVVDYVTGTDHNMMSKGILVQHTQTGAHGNVTAPTVTTTGNIAVGGALAVTGTTTHTGATVLTGAVSGAGYNTLNLANPYKFLAYYGGGSLSYGTAKIPVNNKLYDTNSNFNTTTNRYVAPVTGYYHFSWAGRFFIVSGTYGVADLYVNGSFVSSGSWGGNYSGTNLRPSSNGSIEIPLNATDYVELYYECNQSGTFSMEGGVNPYLTFLSGFLVSAT